MLYYFLRCIFFYDKPFVEVIWTGENKTTKKIIYTSQFRTLKTMDDLVRFMDIPIYQKYSILKEFEVVHPWDPARIYSEVEVVCISKKRFNIKMKRLYG